MVGGVEEGQILFASIVWRGKVEKNVRNAADSGKIM